MVTNHPDVLCAPPLSAELLFLQDEEGRTAAVPMVMAAFRITPGGDVTPAEDAELPPSAGAMWGPPATASVRYETQIAFLKPATDVVLIGHAWANGRMSTDVRIRVGPLDQRIRVIGDRVWERTLSGIYPTDPTPFEKIPLRYERAFGGWDRSNDDPSQHMFEPRNPVGTGFRAKNGQFEEGVRLPNLEDPGHPIEKYGATVAPVGVGFTAPHWQPRASLAGTYDANWQKTRSPLFPLDFDRRFFNAASPGMVAPGYLQGNEAVATENVSAGDRLSFRLPGLTPPHCKIRLRGRRDDDMLSTNLDTVIIDTDQMMLVLMWRTYAPLRNGPLDVLELKVGS